MNARKPGMLESNCELPSKECAEEEEEEPYLRVKMHVCTLSC